MLDSKYNMICTLLKLKENPQSVRPISRILQEKQFRKKRKKPIFYYMRLRDLEKKYRLKLEELKKKQKDVVGSDDQLEFKLRLLRTKNRLDQIRIQMRIKRDVKDLKSF